MRATETANYVRQQLPETLQNPKVAIVCGSGLGGLADTIESEPKVALDYANIPNFLKALVRKRSCQEVRQELESQAVKLSTGSKISV